MSDKINLIIKQQHFPHPTKPVDLAWMQGVDGLLVDPAQCNIDDIPEQKIDTYVLDAGDPERDIEWREINSCRWVCKEGLEQIVKLRDNWPELDWVPQLNVFRPQMSYRFSGPAIGEGFSFYIPDTSVIKGWRVTDREILLIDAIKQVEQLGFSNLWLHSLDAESKGIGLELEMLDKAIASNIEIWVSGGVTQKKHLTNLSKYGGASSVIVDEAFAREAGVDALLQALTPDGVGETVPAVSFGCGQSSKLV